ncbi:hypothetical protein [Nocardia sp. NPDC050406]|uniref:F0F1 ATP synthase subunit B family protein n=1 Tax=Nocardia sp. NPDC050406 TaxID=3364318 RepID=UPI003788F4C1
MIGTNDLLAASGWQITFDWPIFLSQLFGFGVIIFIWIKWIQPPVARLMHKAQDTIARQIEDSEEAATRLESAKRSYDNAVAEAQKELEQLREDAKRDAERIVAQMREIAAEEVERVRKQGNTQIALFRRQLIRDLEADLTAAMLDLTEEKVREHVSTPQARSEAVEKFLEDLEVLANGGSAHRRQAPTRPN